MSNSPTTFFANVGTDNAFTPITNDPLLQGSWTCVCAIAEEGVATKGVRWHYNGNEFTNQLVWSMAHELCHLLIGGMHFDHSHYLMTNSNPTPAGITAITSGSDEINSSTLNVGNRLRTRR